MYLTFPSASAISTAPPTMSTSLFFSKKFVCNSNLLGSETSSLSIRAIRSVSTIFNPLFNDFVKPIFISLEIILNLSPISDFHISIIRSNSSPRGPSFTRIISWGFKDWSVHTLQRALSKLFAASDL